MYTEFHAGMDKSPLLLPAIILLFGTILPVKAGYFTPLFLFLLCVCLALGALLFLRKGPRVLCYSILMAGFFTYGAYLSHTAEGKKQKELDLLRPWIVEGSVPLWTGFVEREPEKGNGYVVLNLRLESVERGQQRLKIGSGVRLTIYDSIHPTVKAEYLIGDRIRFPSALQRPKNYSNPGMFDYQAFLERRNILLVGSLKTPSQLQRLEGIGCNSLLYYSAVLRRSFSGFLQKQFSLLGPDGDRTSGIIDGLLFGRRERMDPEIEELFRITGTYHIFVVSGFNTALIAVFLIWCLRLLRLPVWLQVVGTSAALLFYMIMTDLNLPVVRATIFSILVLIAHVIWRQTSLPNSIALSGLVLLFFWPESARDVGFQLTFLSCLAIACIAVPFIENYLLPWRLSLHGFFTTNVHLLQYDRIHRWARRLHFELEVLMERILRAIGDPRGMISKLMPRLILFTGDCIFYLVGILIVSVSVHFLLAPLMADSFHRANLASAPANLLVVPVMTLMLLGSLCVGGVLWIFNVTWYPWVFLTVWLSEKTLFCLRWFSEQGGWHWRTPSPPTPWMYFYYGLWMFCLLPFPRRIRFVAFLAVLVCFPTFLWSPFPVVHESGTWEVWFFDVGHGDSILNIFPSGETILVDGGGSRGKSVAENDGMESIRTRFDVGEDVLCPALWTLRVKRLDHVVLTHPESDHYGGLHAVLRNFPVGGLWGPWPVEKWISSVPGLQRLAEEKNLEWQSLIKGDSFSIDGLRLDVISPPETLLGPYARINNRSVVLLGRYLKSRLLLTGDLEKAAEFDLLQDCRTLQAEVLKVAHHGSETSSHSEFLECVHPEYAVISSREKASVSIPMTGTLERIHTIGAKIYRTSDSGAIHVRFLPAETKIDTFLEH